MNYCVAPPVAGGVVVVAPVPSAGGVMGVVPVAGADVDGAVVEGVVVAGAAASSFLLQALKETARTEARIRVLVIMGTLLCDGLSGGPRFTGGDIRRLQDIPERLSMQIKA